jgi:hypothetical protein
MNASGADWRLLAGKRAVEFRHELGDIEHDKRGGLALRLAGGCFPANETRKVIGSNPIGG